MNCNCSKQMELYAVKRIYIISNRYSRVCKPGIVVTAKQLQGQCAGWGGRGGFDIGQGG